MTPASSLNHPAAEGSYRGMRCRYPPNLTRFTASTKQKNINPDRFVVCVPHYKDDPICVGNNTTLRYVAREGDVLPFLIYPGISLCFLSDREDTGAKLSAYPPETTSCHFCIQTNIPRYWRVEGDHNRGRSRIERIGIFWDSSRSAKKTDKKKYFQYA